MRRPGRGAAAKAGLAAVAVTAGLAGAPAAHAMADRADTDGPLDLAVASLRQDGEDLVVSVRTRGGWASRALISRPGRSLCFVLFQSTRRRYLCASATPAGSPAVTVDGAPLAARVQRPGLTSLTARFRARAAGLSEGRFRWVVTSTWSDDRDCRPGRPPCRDRLPDRGDVSAELLPPTPTGCRAAGGSYRTHGPRTRRAVALTFDDGPSPFTARVLDVLRREGARGTCFVLGPHVGAGAGVLRRAVREGHALANHTWSHANVSGGGRGQLARTHAAVRRATGYTPCLFRAPYGAVSGTIIAQARSLGMLTIQWDVDPRDWALPGAGAIQARVVSASRAGSIVVMHDGGGPRRQTLAALPGIVRTLRRRGYRLVTVPELLGLRATG